jgi:membrane fusion protein, multidrug efflux system
MKHSILKPILFLVTLFLLTNCKPKVTTVTSELEVPVSVSELVPSVIEEFVNTTGTVTPSKEATLFTEMAGDYVLQINPETQKPYALGDKVKKGNVIIRIEDEEYKNSIRIKSKELDLEISKQELEKQQSLYEKGGATLRELKNAEIKYINTQYDIENARLNIAKMAVVAPFAGTIVSLPYFTQGTKVKNGTEVVRLVNNKQLYLEANLPEKYYNTLITGFDVYVTNYNLPDDTLKGNITQIAPAIDPNTRTFKVMISVDNFKEQLLPGMFVKADLVVNRVENAIVIPKEIIKGRGRSQSVFISDKGYAAERRIYTGIENDDRIEVTGGLQLGDKLVVRGYETLRDKAKLKIVE